MDSGHYSPGDDQTSSGSWEDPRASPDPGPGANLAPSPSHDPILLTIGDIGVSRHWVVTPNGTAHLAGSRWIARDMSRTESKIPTWAIVLAIIFAFF